MKANLSITLYINYLGFKGETKKSLGLAYAYNSLALKVNDKQNIAQSMHTIGRCYSYLGEFEKSITYFQKSILLYKANNQPQFEKTVNNLIAYSFYNSNNLDKAIEYSLKTISQAHEAKDAYLEAEASYLAIGCYLNTKDFKKAEPLCHRTIALYDSLNRPKNKAKCLIDLSRIYFENKQLDFAISTIENALNYFEKTNSYFYIVNCQAFLGKYYLGKKDLKKAELYLNSAIELATKNDLKLHFPMIYEIMIDLKKAENDYKAAFFYKEKYQIHLDSLNSNELKQQMQNLDVKFQTKQKETQINLQAAQLKQKTTNNYLLLGGLSTLAIISLLGFRNYKSKQVLDKQRITELETKQQLTATEAVLKGEEQERTRLAKDLHDGLGGMLSGIKHSFASIKGNMVMSADNTKTFERSLDMVDNSIKEMRRVAHNMMPEALVKFGLNTALIDYCGDINDSGVLKIDYKGIGIDKDEIDQTKAITIYRIIQELTNNTIKHAHAKTAIVQVINNENKINITVEDDGQGFDKTILKTAKGIGWSNIYNRVEFLKGKIEVDSTIGKGTSVFIEI